MDAVAKHRSHPEIVKRLRRAEGHLRSVIAMIEAERSCLEIAQQIMRWRRRLVRQRRS